MSRTNSTKPSISIIIRTKNEEKWVTHCLSKIFEQSLKNFEVIIVDNHSTDYTIKLAKKFPVKILKINKYLPGKALNMGIQEARGKYIVCLSAHCIPKHKNWLKNLLTNFKNKKIAGAYGRQIPFKHSSDMDKRDLLITFGLDKKIQKKDYFFHNANSMIRKDVWNDIPFDDKTTNIEDRLWGKAVINAGYQIAYEPEAEVYHYHGIHQNQHQERCEKIIKIIEKNEQDASSFDSSLDFKKINIAVILPIKGKQVKINGINLLERCNNYFQKSKLIDRIYILTDQKKIDAIPNKKVNIIPRPKSLSSSSKTIEDVLQYTIKQIEKKYEIPDLIIYANYLYPFRPENLIDLLINTLFRQNLDTVIAGVPDYSIYWMEKNHSLQRIDAGSFLSREKKKPIYRSLIGLGCVTYPKFLKNGRIFGDKVGIVPILNDLYHINLRNKNDFNKKITKLLIKQENSLCREK